MIDIFHDSLLELGPHDSLVEVRVRVRVRVSVRVRVGLTDAHLHIGRAHKAVCLATSSRPMSYFPFPPR